MYIWPPNKPKFESSMKAFLRVVIILLTVSFAFANTSCSKKSHGFNYKSDPKQGATSYDPVATKHQPVRKKYIVNSRRKTILGHEKPIKK